MANRGPLYICVYVGVSIYVSVHQRLEGDEHAGSLYFYICIYKGDGHAWSVVYMCLCVRVHLFIFWLIKDWTEMTTQALYICVYIYILYIHTYTNKK